jgi:Spy/CpxP family protein refolding chaperone
MTMRSLTRLAIVAALLGSGIALRAQTPEKSAFDPTIKKSPGAPPSKTPLDQAGKVPRDAKSKMSPDQASKIPRDASSKFGHDPFDAFYPPELVMEHQIELGLGDSERQLLRQAVQQAQVKFTDLQWRLSAETERLDTILRAPVLQEREVLEQVDRVLALERDLKRTKIALLVRIKNALTPEQQAKLAELRTRKQ